MEQGAQRTLLLSTSGVANSEPNFGNPSSIHWAGRRAKAAVENAREAIALALGVEDPDEICFTGSATESINTAIKGFFFAHAAERPVIITSAVEHEATLESVSFVTDQGAETHILRVNERGELDLAALGAALAAAKGRPTLVSLLAANNETGVIFPWMEAAKLARSHGAVFHLDAVQAPGKLPGFTLRGAPVDLASFSAHKIGGAKGVGALVVRRGVKIVSLLHGGAQERSRRSGTMNVPGIMAFGAAAEALAARDLAGTNSLREKLERLVREQVPGAHVQGAGAPRLVNTSNFLFDGVRGEGLVMALDLAGFAVSSGSACNSGSILPSHVLLAMGFDKAAAASAVRVSLGPANTEADVEAFVAALSAVVARIRERATSVATT